MNDFDNYDGINRLEAALKIIASGSYRYGEKTYFFDEKYKTDFINMICVYLSDIEKIQFFIFLYEKFKSFFDLDIVQKRIVEMDAINKKTLINLLKYKRAILSLETIKNTLENDHD